MTNPDGQEREALNACLMALAFMRSCSMSGESGHNNDLVLNATVAARAALAAREEPDSTIEEARCHAELNRQAGEIATLKSKLAAREKPGYDWKSKTTWRLRVCEICGRDAANLALTPSCEHRMVEVVVAPLAAREEPQTYDPDQDKRPFDELTRAEQIARERIAFKRQLDAVDRALKWMGPQP